jgi:peptide/nickel transport system substrate-binding protein
LRKYTYILLMLIVVILITIPGVKAQNEVNAIVIATTGPADTMGPIDPVTCRSVETCEVANFLFPHLIGVDPLTQNFAPGAPGNSLVESWNISDDGTVYTFNLRSDRSWSDGVPITSNDVYFTHEASGGNFGYIEDVSKPDRFTLRVEYSLSTCDALTDWNIGILPAHAFNNDPNAVQGNVFNLSPWITAGPFRFGDVDSNQMTLIADDSYATGGMGVSALYIVSTQDDEDRLERFVTGEINYAGIPPQLMNQIRAHHDFQYFEFAGPDWDYVGLNLADPTNPQPGQDEDYYYIDQGHHPIFGDRQVRRALQHGLDIDTIINEAVFGRATQMPSYTTPTSWAYDLTLQPIPYNTQMAERLLVEAGWVMGDDGVRVASGARYAEDDTELRFTLFSNRDDTNRIIAANTIKKQLSSIGVAVDVELVDFDNLLDIISSQTYDAYLAGWRNPFPTDPNPYIFLSGNDHLDWFNNSGSYSNPRLDELYDEARTLEGCNQRERIELFQEMQRIIQDDQPYLFLYSLPVVYAANNEIQRFDPFPNMPFWNIEEWSVGR